MNWTALGLGATILAFIGYIWYTIRQQAVSATEIEAQTAAKEAEAQKRIILEQEAAKEEKAVRDTEAKNVQKINDSHDVNAARILLGNSFKDSSSK